MGTDLREYVKPLKECELFRDLDDDEVVRLLEKMHAHVVEYARDEIICHPGDIVREMFVVLDGVVSLIAEEDEGEGTVLNVLRMGQDFGAHMIFSGCSCTWMQVMATTRCKVIYMDVSGLGTPPCEGNGEFVFLNNMLVSFARRGIDLYQKVRLFGQRRVRSRIRIFLTEHLNDENEVVLPMNRTQLADFLGVERTALARELSRMRADGLIEVEGRRIRALNPEYFRHTL